MVVESNLIGLELLELEGCYTVNTGGLFTHIAM